MRRFLFVAAATVALTVLGPASIASAEPHLTVSALRQEAGYVEFYLSGIDLPAGNSLSAQALTATVNDRKLDLTAQQVAQSGQGRSLKRGVVLVIDTSGSMNGAPLAAAKSAVTQFLTTLAADVNVAIVTAGVPSVVALRPTADRQRAKDVVTGLQARGETTLYDSVKSAAGLLGSDYADRRIVVLSDGADTASATTLEEARNSVAKIPVDTVAFKTEEAVATALATISDVSKGRKFQAGDDAALRNVFTQAAGVFSVQLMVKVTVPKELEGKEERLILTANVAGTAVTTDFTVTFVPDTKGSTPLVGEISQGIPLWVEFGLIGLVFVGLLGLGILVAGPMLGSAGRRQRLAQVQQFQAVPRHAPAPQPADAGFAQAALQVSEQVMKQTNTEGRLAQQLDRAGMKLRPHEWLLIRAGILLGCVFVLAILATPWYLGAVLGALVGWASTALYHRLRASRRLAAFDAQLPDALQLVIGSLRSGFSLTQSVDAMLREIGDPISTEFGRALGETRLGVDIEDALDRVATRMKSKDLAFVVVAIRVQREIGGNLAEVLNTTVATMRERAMLQRHVRALSAEGRLSAYVLIALPIGILAYMLFIRAGYLASLVQSPLGWLLAGFGVIELIVGTFWMLKVVKVEV